MLEILFLLFVIGTTTVTTNIYFWSYVKLEKLKRMNIVEIANYLEIYVGTLYRNVVAGSNSCTYS